MTTKLPYLGQRGLVDDAATGRVDEVRSPLDLAELLSADEPAGRVVERAVNRDEVGRLHQLVERDQPDPGGLKM